MTGIQFFKNTAGNVTPSDIGHDMGIHPNGEFFFQKGRVVARILRNGLIAINPVAGLKIPMYLKKIPIARLVH